MTETPVVGPPLTNDPLLPIKGGWDGVVVSFGDGCDDDTFTLLYGELIARKYVLRVTRVGSRRDDNSIATTITEDVRMVGTSRTPEAGWFRVHLLHINEMTGEPVGAGYAVEFDDILAIHIY